jgi:hypothetical protein
MVIPVLGPRAAAELAREQPKLSNPTIVIFRAVLGISYV